MAIWTMRIWIQAIALHKFAYNAKRVSRDNSSTHQEQNFCQALHATKSNEVLHIDYLYMGPSESGHKYLLLVKDDLSNYLWLVPAITADAATTVEELTSWFAAFGVATT